jgi:hypothetical protein
MGRSLGSAVWEPQPDAAPFDHLAPILLLSDDQKVDGDHEASGREREAHEAEAKDRPVEPVGFGLT